MDKESSDKGYNDEAYADTSAAAAVDAVEMREEWAKHESALCELCKTVLAGYDLAASRTRAATFWDALDNVRGEEPDGHLLLATDRSLFGRAADGCHLCKVLLDQIAADKVEDMQKRDSLGAGGEGTSTATLTYKQDLDPLIFLSSNGQLLPSILDLRVRFDVGEADPNLRDYLRSRLLVVQNEDLSNLPHAIEANTGSDSTFTLANKWLRQCVDTHDCHASWAGFETGFFPSFLIDVGDSKPPKPRLCRGEEARAQDFRYLTLSHCWGHAQFMKLTHENLRALMEGIDYDILPKTFQDAMIVVQQLHQRYLWIDSLCIIQNSVDIWLRESAVMGQIYSNSICNICATAASNGGGGLFHDRDPSSVKLVVAQIKNDGIAIPCSLYPRYFWDYNIEDAPLIQRAWVCQERLLSPCNLHFAAEQVVWECRTVTACESAPAYIPEVFTNAYTKRDIAYFLSLTEPILSDAPAWQKPGKFWYSVTALYTSGQLSFSTDKLVAVSGLAAQMYRLFNDEYLAGLWRTNLILQLLWFPLCESEFPELVDSEYVAPTWSWASFRGSVGGTYVTPASLEVIIDIIEAKVELASSNQFGKVSAGHLTVKGKLAKAIYRTFSGTLNLLPGVYPMSLHVQADDEWALEIPEPIAQEKLLSASWSWSREQVMSQSGVVYLLPCIKDELTLPGRGKPGYDQVEGLVLVETGNKPGEFYRCGSFSVRAVKDNSQLKIVQNGCQYFDAHCAESGLQYSQDLKLGLVYTVTII